MWKDTAVLLMKVHLGIFASLPFRNNVHLLQKQLAKYCTIKSLSYSSKRANHCGSADIVANMIDLIIFMFTGHNAPCSSIRPRCEHRLCPQQGPSKPNQSGTAEMSSPNPRNCPNIRKGRTHYTPRSQNIDCGIVPPPSRVLSQAK